MFITTSRKLYIYIRKRKWGPCFRPGTLSHTRTHTHACTHFSDYHVCISTVLVLHYSIHFPGAKSTLPAHLKQDLEWHISIAWKGDCHCCHYTWFFPRRSTVAIMNESPVWNSNFNSLQQNKKRCMTDRVSMTYWACWVRALFIRGPLLYWLPCRVLFYRPLSRNTKA